MKTWSAPASRTDSYSVSVSSYHSVVQSHQQHATPIGLPCCWPCTDTDVSKGRPAFLVSLDLWAVPHLFRPFVTGSDESVREHAAGESASPPHFCCADCCRLSQAVSSVADCCWCFMEWHCPLSLNLLYDFRLLPRTRWELRSSGLLRSE